MPQQITVTVNGLPYTLTVPADRMLIDVLRYDLALTGTKEACGVGVCGVCTVLLDGEMVSSCLVFAIQADGRAVTTIEGLGDPEHLSPLQRAFIEQGGFQCGICTPGQIVAATALLREHPAPSEDEIKAWMSGNLCRCTGYYQILRAIKAAAS
ncbi:MAG: (2Fe-2S)-binding protein [Chloroflexota bacterium]|nr:(2Fe-2S)-binding protein [Dehalococcoidia bacterium]MDW8254423.1 (2Fe-2S)-binding protein [Chloroflexota bacterium]